MKKSAQNVPISSETVKKSIISSQWLGKGEADECDSVHQKIGKGGMLQLQQGSLCSTGSPVPRDQSSLAGKGQAPCGLQVVPEGCSAAGQGAGKARASDAGSGGESVCGVWKAMYFVRAWIPSDQQ